MKATFLFSILAVSIISFAEDNTYKCAGGRITLMKNDYTTKVEGVKVREYPDHPFSEQIERGDIFARLATENLRSQLEREFPSNESKLFRRVGTLGLRYNSPSFATADFVVIRNKFNAQYEPVFAGADIFNLKSIAFYKANTTWGSAHYGKYELMGKIMDCRQ